MDGHAKRVIVVEPSESKRHTLAGRLRSQGYVVDALACGADAAERALAAPPSAVIADLWMPGVSGVQLCRLLKAELATENVPVVLRGPSDTPRQRFWADRAGAAAYVAKGRVGELMRSLHQAIAAATPSDGFFQLHPDDLDIRDRICAQLDAALYQSVLASEVRALSTCESFPRLFDMLSQFACQVTTYRWLAVLTREPARLAVHAHPDASAAAEAEARAVLGIEDDVPILRIEDEDAVSGDVGAAPVVRDMRFGAHHVGRVALAPGKEGEDDGAFLDLVAQELGGPIRIVTLVEETERLASKDPLTGLLNRRAFGEAIEREMARAHRLDHALSLLLLDADHFKAINDTHGHPAGDAVLRVIAQVLSERTRPYDYPGRWGGEEFVVALPHAGESEAMVVAERLRASIEALEIDVGAPLSVTASIGVATWVAGEPLATLLERADRAMYAAKSSGRNRVMVASHSSRPAGDTRSPERAESIQAGFEAAVPDADRPHSAL